MPLRMAHGAGLQMGKEGGHDGEEPYVDDNALVEECRLSMTA